MTKTLTEQWRDGTLPDGCYYVLSTEDDTPVACDIDTVCDFMIRDVIAPVPDYGSLYNPNDGRIPVGLFTVLKLIKRDIEQYQKMRHLTDLECGIKSQVVSLLKRWGVK